MTGTDSSPQQQQTQQQAKQQQQKLQWAQPPSAPEARLLFLHDEISRLLKELGFIVRDAGSPLGQSEDLQPLPRGVSVWIDQGTVLVESDAQGAYSRMRESFRLVPEAIEGVSRYLLSRYQLPPGQSMEFEPGYFRTRSASLMITEGLPHEIKEALEAVSTAKG